MGGININEIVAVTGADTTPGFLADKMLAGAGMTQTVVNPAADEDLRFDVIANADGSIIANANDIQVGILATDAQHGTRGGGTQHAVVTGAVNGFMIAADKTKLDGIGAGANVTSVFGRTGIVTALEADYSSFYLVKAGLAGGQLANGGLNAGDILTLSGSASTPDKGRVHCSSPFEILYDTASNTTPADSFAMRWRPTATVPAYIGGFLSVGAQLTTSGSTYVPATFSDTGTTFVASNLGFAAHTFINYLHLATNAAFATHLSCIAFNMGFNSRRTAAGTSTAASITGFSFSPQSSTTASGAVMTKTTQSAVRCSPTWNTVAGSTVNLGTINAVQCFEPAVALFGSSAGTENMTAYNGMLFPDMTFGGASAVYNVVNSALNSGTNKRFLNHTGTAISTLRGSIDFDVDGVGVIYGASSDFSMAWVGAGYQQLAFAANTSQLRWSNPSSGRFLFDNNNGSTSGEYNFNALKMSFGAQTGAVGNQKFAFVSGAETITVGGDYSGMLWTYAANDIINAALGTYATATWNAGNPTLGTGSIVTNAIINIGGNPAVATTNRVAVRILSNPSGGSGVNAALWLTAGRARFDGPVDINAPIALGAGGAATLGLTGATGPAATAQNEWVQIEVNGNTRFLAAWA